MQPLHTRFGSTSALPLPPSASERSKAASIRSSTGKDIFFAQKKAQQPSSSPMVRTLRKLLLVTAAATSACASPPPNVNPATNPGVNPDNEVIIETSPSLLIKDDDERSSFCQKQYEEGGDIYDTVRGIFLRQYNKDVSPSFLDAIQESFKKLPAHTLDGLSEIQTGKTLLDYDFSACFKPSKAITVAGSYNSGGNFISVPQYIVRDLLSYKTKNGEKEFYLLRDKNENSDMSSKITHEVGHHDWPRSVTNDPIFIGLFNKDYQNLSPQAQKQLKEYLLCYNAVRCSMPQEEIMATMRQEITAILFSGVYGGSNSKYGDLPVGHFEKMFPSILELLKTEQSIINKFEEFDARVNKKTIKQALEQQTRASRKAALLDLQQTIRSVGQHLDKFPLEAKTRALQSADRDRKSLELQIRKALKLNEQSSDRAMQNYAKKLG